MADAGILGNDNPSTKKRVGRFFEEHRLVIQAGFDCLAWAFSIPAALILRYEFELSPKKRARYCPRPTRAPTRSSTSSARR